MNNFEEVDKKLVKALMSFTYDSRPFWTLLAMRLKRVPSKNLESFCTVVTANAVELHYNPAFVQKHEQSFLKYMFLHECLHLIYRHMFRFSFSKDMVDVGYLKNNPPKVYKPIAPVKSADIAADLAANRDLFMMFPDYQGYGVKHEDIQQFAMKDFANASAEDIEKYVLDTYLPVQGGGSSSEGGGEQKGSKGKGKEGKGKDSGALLMVDRRRDTYSPCRQASHNKRDTRIQGSEKTPVHIYRPFPQPVLPGDRQDTHDIQPGPYGYRQAEFVKAEPPEYPHPHRAGQGDTESIRVKFPGRRDHVGRLFADRTAHHGPSQPGHASDRGIQGRQGRTRHHGIKDIQVKA